MHYRTHFTGFKPIQPSLRTLHVIFNSKCVWKSNCTCYFSLECQNVKTQNSVSTLTLPLLFPSKFITVLKYQSEINKLNQLLPTPSSPPRHYLLLHYLFLHYLLLYSLLLHYLLLHYLLLQNQEDNPRALNFYWGNWFVLLDMLTPSASTTCYYLLSHIYIYLLLFSHP